MVGNVEQNWWILRVLFGAMGIFSGIDKFTNILVDWSTYLWSFIPSLLNIAPDTFMFFVGMVEIAAGILIFTRYTKYAAYFFTAWLLGIALNLLIAGFWDIAVRDVGLAVGAFVLGNLSPAPEAQARTRKATRTTT